MKKIIFIFTIVFLSYNCNSQSINDNWIIGNNLVHFDQQNISISTAPINITNGAGARAIVSQEDGGILFYLANNNRFYNKNGNIISPTSNLYSNFFGNSYAALQNAIIIPNKKIPGEYFVFAVSDYVLLNNSNTFYLYFFVIIDFNDNLYPLGKIKNYQVLNQIQNVRGFSGLASTKKGTDDGYFSILTTSNGVNVTPLDLDTNPMSLNFTNYPMPGISNQNHSMIKISPDGSTIATLIGDDAENWYLYVADFNDIDGMISNVRLAKHSSIRIKDIEFSANSGLLYMMMGSSFGNDLIGERILVKDLSNNNKPEIEVPETNIIYKDNFQRAPNGDLYFTDLQVNNNVYSSTKLFKINYSNNMDSVLVDQNYHQLLNPIQYSIDNFWVLHKELGTIPELVATTECILNIETSDTSIVRGQVRKKASKSISLNNKIDNSGFGYYSAGDSVIMRNGFTIKSGANIVFKVEDCNPSSPKPNIIENSQDSRLINEIKVYPNPFNNRINLDLENLSRDENFNVYVYDVNGRIVYSKKLQGKEIHNISLDKLNQGLFILKIFNENFVEEFKIIKN